MKSPLFLVLLFSIALLAQVSAQSYVLLVVDTALTDPFYKGILADARRLITKEALEGKGDGLVFPEKHPMTYNQITMMVDITGFNFHFNVEMVDICDDVYNIEFDLYAISGARKISKPKFTKKHHIYHEYSGHTHVHGNGNGHGHNFRGSWNH